MRSRKALLVLQVFIAATSILITPKIPATCSPDTAGSVGGSVRAHGLQAEQGVPDEGAVCRNGGACNPRLITEAPILLLVKSRIPLRQSSSGIRFSICGCSLTTHRA